MAIDNLGMFLRAQLEQRIETLFEQKYAALWAEEGRFLPAVGDLEMGAQDVTEQTVKQIGEAAIMADMANDIPVSDAVIDETRFKTVCVVTQFEYSILEIERAEKAGVPLRMVKMQAADRALRQRVHKLAVFGSSKHNMGGFFNNSSVQKKDDTYDAYASDITTKQHIDFIADNLTKVRDESNLVEGVEYLLVPISLLTAWTKAQITGSGHSVYQYIMDNYGQMYNGTLRGIFPINECRGIDLRANGVTIASNKDRVVFVSENPQIAQRKFYPTQLLEPQLQGMLYRNYLHTGTTEAIIHYPGAMRYVDVKSKP